jgi:putative aldouronate transport system permease protein
MTILLILAVSMAYPVWYIVINSIAGMEEVMRGAVHIFPNTLSLNSYRAVFKNSNILNAFGITIARTALASAVHVLFTAMVAYAYSKPYLLGRKLYMRIGVITMLFNGGLIPTFLLLNKLHLYNTFWVYIFPAMFSFYNAVIFMSFYKSIPVSMEEAAKIDGAGDFRIFFTIVLPNSKPVLATIGLFAAVYNWNDYFMGVVYIKNQKLLPVQTILYKIVAENSTSAIAQQAQSQLGMRISPQSIKSATMVIVVFPIIVLYPFLQKYFVKGMMMGSIKE